MSPELGFSCTDLSTTIFGQRFQCNGVRVPRGKWFAMGAEADDRGSAILALIAGLESSRRSSRPAEGHQLLRSRFETPLNELEGICVNGRPLHAMDPATRAKMIGFVFEDPELFIVGRTVLEDFNYSFACVDEPRPEAQLLKRYGLLGKLRRRTEHLSGGERHRLNCASVLELPNEVIVGDFSFSNLDREFVAKLRVWLSEEKAKGKAILTYGLPELFGPEALDGFLRVQDNALFEVSELDRDIFPTVADESRQLSEICELRNLSDTVVLRVDGVGRKDGITDKISFKLMAGQILQIWGENGCGKTTLAKHIAGVEIDAMFSGAVTLAPGAHPVLALQSPERLFLESTVGEEIGNRDLLEMAGIPEKYWTAHPRKLSRGYRKALAVLVAFCRSGRLVLLDEPTCGMDFRQKRAFVRLLNHFKDHAVLIFSHDEAISEVGNVVEWRGLVV